MPQMCQQPASAGVQNDGVLALVRRQQTQPAGAQLVVQIGGKYTLYAAWRSVHRGTVVHGGLRGLMDPVGNAIAAGMPMSGKGGAAQNRNGNAENDRLIGKMIAERGRPFGGRHWPR